MDLLIGQVIGIQEILEIDINNPNTKKHQKSCKCKCIECGKITYRANSALKNGSAISCRCQNSKRMTLKNFERTSIKIGIRYGDLIVKEYLGFRKQKRGRNESWYRCECLGCGNQNFEVRGNNLVSGMTKSCGCIKSYGEKIIAEILSKNNISFKKQYIFPELKDKGKLRFDFAIFDEFDKLQFLIEFDGRQHYSGPEAKWRETSFEDIKRRDELKNQYCKNNNIILKRIPFWEQNDITLEKIFSDKWDIN